MSEDDIIKSIGAPALYEQLAEEASELVQAALKCARIFRKENPTPVSMHEAENNLIEEYTDVILSANMLELYCDGDIFSRKKERWVDRVKNKSFNEE